ncbi:hypothetical protein HU724_019015 [Pseudomonas iranensis]|uniref:hypothetical protein n=1 Tax=Pseudomonas iranensis TaxID=2745503 RepID=UPI00164543B5|nr:hypothetical protein [Pseudomonas iranensis]QXI21106.1 hypothetical protein HU724_019015 [Pseudomonas iranensis]
MIYEKKEESSTKYVLGVALLACFLVAEYFYLYVDFSKEFWVVKFVDVANVIAQFATAGAFYLGFHQYHRNKRVERQAVIVLECKNLILKMVAASKEFDVGENTSFSNIKYCCTKLGNLGSDFDVLFAALDEGIQKAIVRMHWQEMYFNELQHVMQGLELRPALSATAGEKLYYLLIRDDARKKAEAENILEGFFNYFVLKEVLAHYLESELLDFTFEFSDLYFFFLFFFESKHTNDYMYGSMSRLDIRARAPMIAAIKDAYKIDIERFAPKK